MNETQVETKKVKPKISKLAIASFTIGIIALLCMVSFAIFYNIYQSSVGLKTAAFFIAKLFLYIAIPSLFFAIILTIITLVFDLIKGNIKELFIVLLIFFLIILSIGIIMPTLGRITPVIKSQLCGMRLTILGRALSAYAESHNGYLPALDKWCDTLIIEESISLIDLLCKSHDTIEGESSYAMNSKLKGIKLSQIAQDVVVIFETDSGRTQEGRQEQIKSREFYQWFRKKYSLSYESDGTKKVYGLQWNQSGGPEILTAEHHNSRGANILFGDLHAEFVPKEQFGDLKWK